MKEFLNSLIVYKISKNHTYIKKTTLALIICASSLYSTKAQDSTETAPSANIPPIEKITSDDEDLFAMDFEDLLSMEVTSVSKKAERLQDVAASLYVVTSDDITKSGATNLHEVLRTVPGYWGTQIEYNNPSQSMRYSSSIKDGSAGTVLFLLDGTPIQDLMAGTFSFKNFDIPLDEIDRIEVIRGSGGTVYGANSATGVISIFTKNPEEYDGINLKAEAATPGYRTASVRAAGKITEDLHISGYAKYKLFNGYGSLAGKDSTGSQLPFESRYTENYDKQTNLSFGLKAKYQLSKKGGLSLNTHYNTLSTIDYTNIYPTDHNFLKAAGNQYDDVLFKNEVSASRFVGNLRYDHEFNENHSVFLRASTNTENDFRGLGGGHKISNAIYDFEIQDNISIGSMNDLSVGANYRSVNYDVFDINSESTISYVNPQNSENLKGAFIQDKIKFLDGKLNLIVGLKAENFSLINNDYYFSPMAKVSWIPVENFTLWGGFTQAYTTPGYSNTNIDYNIYQAPTQADYTTVGTGLVYQDVYDANINGGATAEQAAAAAGAFVADPANSALISGTAAAVEASLPSLAKVNAAVKNGTNTVPTKFQSWEAGFRLSGEGRIMFESNVFYTNISDGIATAPDGAAALEESPTQPGIFSVYYLYGNYVKGQAFGTETMLKVKSTDGITFEFAHSWLQNNWQFQENDDFDIHDVSIISPEDRNKTPEVPTTPKHVFRIKTYIDLPAKVNFSLGVIYATSFNTETEYKYNGERYANFVFEDGEGTASPNNSRTIVNLRIEKLLLEDKLSIYAFGNDIFNEGVISNTERTSNVTLSQIKRMYGLGANYKF